MKFPLYLVALLLMASNAAAQILHYTDSNGRKVFVDSIAKVPAEYRDQLKVRTPQQNRLSQEERAQREVRAGVEQQKLAIRQQKRRIENNLKLWRTPYRYESNRLVIPVKVAYGNRSKTLDLVIDTGATSTVLHKSAIASLQGQLIPGGNARIADGSVIQTQNINLSSVEIGPYKGDNIVASVIEYGGVGGSQGLLGMDFLYSARYEVDRTRQEIVWNPERFRELQAQLTELEEMEATLDNPALLEGNASSAISSITPVEPSE